MWLLEKGGGGGAARTGSMDAARPGSAPMMATIRVGLIMPLCLALAVVLGSTPGRVQQYLRVLRSSRRCLSPVSRGESILHRSNSTSFGKSRIVVTTSCNRCRMSGARGAEGWKWWTIQNRAEFRTL